MREICMSGSEGEGTEINRFSLPLFGSRPFGPKRINLKDKSFLVTAQDSHAPHPGVDKKSQRERE
jgi:hypothetical protein